MTETAVVRGLASLGPQHGRLFVVVGVFDGLHRGHLYLLRHLRREAARRDARPAVVTFDAHPDEILVGTAPPLLVDADERIARLARAGVEVTVVQHFDRSLRETEYDAFVRMISSRAALAGFLMTPDAAFGHERRGTPEALAALGRREGFEVVVVPPYAIESRAVRSSDIRSAIADGDLGRARRLLGRGHAVVGQPADGQLRFELPVALPPAGRYAVSVQPAWTVAGPVGSARRTEAGIGADAVVRPVGSLREGRRLRLEFRDRA